MGYVNYYVMSTILAKTLLYTLCILYIKSIPFENSYISSAHFTAVMICVIPEYFVGNLGFNSEGVNW